MQDFIVLGIIPGTNVQLDFNDWLLITLSLIVAYNLVRYIVRHAHRIKTPLLLTAANTALSGPVQLELEI